MKGGLVSCLAALDALARVGYRPAADLFVQSVIEEECTGNGALACLARGYRAAAALIPEPVWEKLVRAQVGVLWFQVKVRGMPVHVREAGNGANAIEAAFGLMRALHRLEQAWNDRRESYPPFDGVAHPINLNVGKIAGVIGPQACRLGALSMYAPQFTPDKASLRPNARSPKQYATRRAKTASSITFLRKSSTMASRRKDICSTGQRSRLRCFEMRIAASTVPSLTRSPRPAPRTPDFSVFTLTLPRLSMGPIPNSIHGFDERLDLDLLRRVTQVIALFVANWCGLEKR